MFKFYYFIYSVCVKSSQLLQVVSCATNFLPIEMETFTVILISHFYVLLSTIYLVSASKPRFLFSACALLLLVSSITVYDGNMIGLFMDLGTSNSNHTGTLSDQHILTGLVWYAPVHFKKLFNMLVFSSWYMILVPFNTQ